MIDLFYEGGILFMSLVTLGFLPALVMAVRTGLLIHQGAENERVLRSAEYVKSLGLFALVLGVLGQIIGLYGAFEAIADAGEVSQALLAGGLRVSSITTIYGMVCCVVSYLIYFGLCALAGRKEA